MRNGYFLHRPLIWRWNMMDKILSFLIILLLIPIPVSIKGETGLVSFLPSDARIQSLQSGSAGVPSVPQNPATSSLLKKNLLSASYSTYFADTSYLTISGIFHFDKYSAGISLLSIGYGDFPSYDISGTSLGNATAGHSSSLFLNISRDFAPFFIMGCNLKFIFENIAENSGNSVALDIGILKQKFFSDRLSISFVLQNLGVGPKFRNIREPLEFNLKFGVSYSIIPLSDKILLKLISDIDYPKSGLYRIGIGSEFVYLILSDAKLFFRTGYKIPQYQTFISSLSFGIGVTYKMFHLDYAITPGEYLGNVNKVSVGIEF